MRKIGVTCDGCGEVVEEDWADNNWFRFDCEHSYGALAHKGLELMGGLEDYDFCSIECIYRKIKQEYDGVREANPGVFDGKKKTK